MQNLSGKKGRDTYTGMVVVLVCSYISVLLQLFLGRHEGRQLARPSCSAVCVQYRHIQQAAVIPQE